MVNIALPVQLFWKHKFSENFGQISNGWDLSVAGEEGFEASK